MLGGDVPPVRAWTPSSEAAEEWLNVRNEVAGIDPPPMPLLPEEALPFWVEAFLQRIKDHFDVVSLQTGFVGTGKSTLALQLIRGISASRGVEWDPSTGLCYGPVALLRAYKELQPGDPVLYDEGVLGLMAGDQASKEQKALIRALALVREKGLILFICAPSIWLVAKQVRQSRATHWFECMHRGLARVEERDQWTPRWQDQELHFRTSQAAPLVEWRKIPETSRLWKGYIAEKRRQLDDFLRETERQLRSLDHSGGPDTPTVRRERARLERKARREKWMRDHPGESVAWRSGSPEAEPDSEDA